GGQLDLPHALVRVGVVARQYEDRDRDSEADVHDQVQPARDPAGASRRGPAGRGSAAPPASDRDVEETEPEHDPEKSEESQSKHGRGTISCSPPGWADGARELRLARARRGPTCRDSSPSP